MSAILATRICTFLNDPISQIKLGIAVERLFTKWKCFNTTILLLCLTQSRQTMSICISISSKLTLMCFYLMRKAALAIP